MSKTDKTRPYWVQFRDPEFAYDLKAHHYCTGTGYHNARECDLDFPIPKVRRETLRTCEWWPRYRDNDKVYGRSDYRRGRYFKKDRKARADLRRLRNKWKTIDREDIDSNENLPTQRWLWRKWYWD